MERLSAQFLQSQDYKPCVGWREHLHSFSRVKITYPLLDEENICTVSPESRLQTLCWMERKSAQFLQSEDCKPSVGWREHLHSFSRVKITYPLLDEENICTVSPESRLQTLC
ncbi:hypothetical protein PoB_004928900 [Plakobranchus ocellatus]|uniref:Uncharacterized protein n=1 Tax=Plakobranchus ocellatus TaxID=259542 RepID=A0AAV4BWK2_9GAST|nr:hypothetical protein PoB_004928900 [Plakobranchus ocellatus]